MKKKNSGVDPTDEVKDLLRKSLVLHLFEMDLPQVEIARRLKMNLNTVNEFLKGIKKAKLN